MIAPPLDGNMLLPGLSLGNPSLEEHSSTPLVWTIPRHESLIGARGRSSYWNREEDAGK